MPSVHLASPRHCVRVLVLLAALALVSAACASGDAATPAESSETGVGTTPGPGGTTDTSPSEAPTEATPTTTAIETSLTSSSDVRRFCEDVWVGDCDQPFINVCTPDGRGIGTCGTCGEIEFVATDCGGQEVCDLDESGVATCRACVGSECPPVEPECESGSVGCFETDQPFRCVEGQIRLRGTCAGGGLCIDGACNTGELQTAPVGDLCDIREECAGDFCMCGDNDDGNPTGTAFDIGCNLLPQGYCTKENCRRDRCNPNLEACIDFEMSGRFGGVSACVERRSCSRRGAECGNGLRCVELPATEGEDAPVSWELVCWPDELVGIGFPCDPETNNCATGDCRTATVAGGARDVSYCTLPCGPNGNACPSQTECVRQGEEFLCLAVHDSDACCLRASPEVEDCQSGDINLDFAERPVYGTQDTARTCFYNVMAAGN